MTERMAFEFTNPRPPKEGEWFCDGNGPLRARNDYEGETYNILIPHPIPEPGTVPVKVEWLKLLRDLAHQAGDPSVVGEIDGLIPRPTLRDELLGLIHSDVIAPFSKPARIFEALQARGIDLEARG